MPKVTKSAIEESENHLANQGNETLNKNVSTTHPTVVCGVSRKVNIGNFENIDIYAGLSIPVEALPSDFDDFDGFSTHVKDVIDKGFALASKEVSDRYHYIKDLQSGDK
jgi:hypothetical protein